MQRLTFRALLVCALAVWGAGCDDSTGSGGGGGEDATGGAGGDSGTDNEMGPGGNVETDAEPPPVCEGECFDDGECGDGQYCFFEEGDAIGCCTAGCRLDPDSCDDGFHCEEASRECVEDPCTSDDDCADTEYCAEPGDNGHCEEGCRDGGACPVHEMGYDQACNTESRECEPLIPCCTQAGLCETSFTCDGQQIPELATCIDGLQCDVSCEADSDCGEDASVFCLDSGVCGPGCREEDPSSCPPEQVCVKGDCVEAPCENDEECPDAGYCDDDGTCHQGCRDNDGCPGEQQCIDHECQEEPPCEGDDDCEAPQYCLEGGCVDLCEGNEDCPDGFFCNEEGRCEAGCRDDANEDDDVQDDAVEMECGGVNGDGFRLCSAVTDENDEPLGLCSDDNGNEPIDWHHVRLEQAERMQITLTHPAENNMVLTLNGVEVGDAIVVDSLDDVKVIEFPEVNDVRNAADYYISVSGAGSDPRAEYELNVVIGDGACFPDPRDLDGNDNTPANAFEVEVNPFHAAGVICAGDEDWFLLDLAQNDGLDIEVLAAPGADELDVQVFSQAAVDNINFPANPNFVADAPMMIAEGTQYAINVPRNADINVAGNWYVRVKGHDAQNLARYAIDIFVDGGMECPDEAGEPGNDAIEGAVDLNDEFGDGGAIPADEDHTRGAAVCPQGDNDWYCFSAGANESFEAWLDCDGFLGEARIEFTDDGGNAVGQGATCSDGGAEARASVRANDEDNQTLCVRVSGGVAGSGEYTLNFRRAEALLGCDNDVDEPPSNNNAAAATAMTPVAGAPAGTRFEHNSGLICEENGPDPDWYSFPVAEARSSVCVMLEGFDNDQGNIDEYLFRDAENLNAERCNNGACGPGLDCVRGRCIAHRPNGAGDTGYDVEAMFLPRAVLGDENGQHLVKVARSDDSDSLQPYTVTASVIPDSAGGDCPADIYEAEDPYPLGDGQKALCDMWACAEGDSNDADNYTIRIPPNQDRTVLIEFPASEGRLFLYTENDNADPDDLFGGFRASEAVAGGFQCINVRASAAGGEVRLTVEASFIQDDGGNNRVDYTLRVVDTDLDENPAGECELLGAPDLGACPADDPHDLGAFGCWQAAALP